MSKNNSSLSVPNHYSPYHLPPTPSTISSTSSLNEDVKEKNKSNAAGELAMKIPSTMQQGYGSLGTPFSEGERPLTPLQTTTSPNENDEGLYLLWTQQLLRERGYKPASCSGNSVEEEDDDLIRRNDDDDSSEASFSSDDDIEDFEEELQDHDIDRYVVEQRKLLPSLSPLISQQPSSTIVPEDEDSDNPSSFTMFFRSCFCL